jgi:hypothetical protein
LQSRIVGKEEENKWENRITAKLSNFVKSTLAMLFHHQTHQVLIFGCAFL